MNRLLQYLSGAAFVALFSGVLWLADLDQVVPILRAVDVRLYAVAAGLFLVTYLFVSLRWQVLQRASGLPLSLGPCFEIIAVSYGLNKLLPANSGDALRSVVTKRYTDVEFHGDVLGPVLVERIADVLTICFVIVVGSMFAAGVSNRLVVLSIGVTISMLFGVWLGFGIAGNDLPDWVPGRLADELHRSVNTIRTLSRSQVAVVGALSLVRWLVLGGSFYVLGRALGLTVPVPIAVSVTAAMSLAAVLPFSPGGIGPVEAVGTGLLVVSNVGYDAAVALVVLQRTFGLGLITLIGVIVYNYRVVVDSSFG